ncbi:DUF802 domain-containing protein [Aquabacterium sp. G14]|uniref:DUF802 domain-containing protein n=1 Tax=Aquabacterium sp. G14 TaxID=3130164 RepID=UPI00309D6B9E
MNKFMMTVIFIIGLVAVGWVGWGFVGASWMALTMTAVIGGVYILGALELRRFRAATNSLSEALAQIPSELTDLSAWVQRLHPSLQHPVRLRIEGQRVAMPGPALTPYLVGLLVMLGMLGTFLGMVVTFKGAVFALEGSANLEAIRAALAAPIKGLGLAFGTSVAGVAASALLGLMSAMSRRERIEVVRQLDAHIATTLRPLSGAHQRDATFKALQAQADAMPVLVDRLQSLMTGLERRSEQLDAQLLAQQQAFHREAATAYTDLAQRVGTALQDSLTASARVAGETLKPMVETAMSQIAQESQRTHQRLIDATQAQLNGLSAQWEGTARQVADTWTSSLQTQSHTQQQLLAGLDGALQAFTHAFEQRAAAVLLAQQDAAAQAQAAQVAADQQRLSEWQGTMATLATTLAAEWQQAGAQTVSQQQAVCQALEAASAQIREQAAQVAASWTTAQHSQTLANENLVGGLDRALQGFTDTFAQRAREVLTSLQDSAAQAQAAQTTADQQRLAAWQQTMDSTAASLAAEWQRVGSQTLAQQQTVCQTLESAAGQITERASQHVSQTLASVTQLLSQSEELVRARLASEQQWIASQGERMDQLSTLWRTELQALRDEEAQRGRAAVERLDALQAAVAQHLATLGTALEAPLNSLLQTASEVPQAAAEVIVQLRRDMAQISERDNLALSERTAMMAQLGTLLQSVNEATGQQRAAIESMVHSATTVLQEAGAQFTSALGQQAGQVDEVAARVAASAVELSSLGESFAHGVNLFSETSDKLVSSLQGIESAIGQSLTRSDEQLAYYVAQAREVIDLSISSQQGIVEDLRRLHGKALASAEGGAR